MTAGGPPSLPRLFLLTDAGLAAGAGHGLCPLLHAAVDAGVRCVVLRERNMHPARRGQLAAALRDLLHGAGGTLLISSGPAEWADGVHLTARDPVPALRPPIVGRSCHDAAELEAAALDGVDYAFVSPVFATASKPGYGPPLGTEGLARLCASTPLSVYALGGITAENAAGCLDAGAAGVAVMGAVMSAPDPGAAARRLVENVDRWLRL